MLPGGLLVDDPEVNVPISGGQPTPQDDEPAPCERSRIVGHVARSAAELHQVPASVKATEFDIDAPLAVTMDQEGRRTLGHGSMRNKGALARRASSDPSEQFINTALHQHR